MFLAEGFGCEVVGIDYGKQNVDRANSEAAERGLSARLRFDQADAESIPLPNASFEAVVCECAICTFPDKSRAAKELARVLRPGGSVGMSDLTRTGELPQELDGLLAWIACIADAQPIERYADWFRVAGLTPLANESHDEARVEMVRQVQAKLLGVELVKGLKKIDLSGHDFTAAKQMANAAVTAIQKGQLGYAIITARKP